MNLFHKYLLNQELGNNVLSTSLIHVEGDIFFQNQHLFIDQFINKNSIFHTQEMFQSCTTGSKKNYQCFVLKFYICLHNY